MPAHRTQNSRHLRVEANPVGAPPINVISPTPQTFVFSANTMNAPNSEASPFSSQATRSLPNLFTTFHASPSGEYNSFLDPSHAVGTHTSSMFTTYRESGSTSFFASPVSSIYGPSPPESPAGSASPSPPPGASPIRERRSRSASRSSPGPYPFPLPPHSNGQVRTQPPRPPNPWICFRNVRSAQYKELNYPEFSKSSSDDPGRSAPSSPSMIPLSLDGDGIDGRRPRQADLSKQISLEWKSLSDEEKAPYIRMSEEAKLIHARIYPGYKYQPRRKPDSANSAANLKTSSAESPLKKGKSKKSTGKNVKTCKAEEKSLDDDTEIEAKHLEMAMEQAPERGLVAPLELPETTIPVATTTIETEEQTGDPTKDWTWLPEQTLLPISWEPDQEIGNAPLGDVMNPLDANVDNTSEHDEIEFGKPFYVSFPSVGQALEEEATPVPFFPFTSEPESETSPFSFSNYDFQGSLGFHLDGFSDISHLPDISGNFDFRRDSFASADDGFNIDVSQSFLPLAEDNAGRGLDLTTEEINNLFTQGSIIPVSATSSISPAPRRASLAHPMPSEEKIPIIPPSPRRSSFAFASASTASKSPDGHLLPPVTIHRPYSRSRANTLPVPPSPFSHHDSTQVRSIPTANFGADGNVATSVLIPLTGPRYDLDLERDLEEYSRAMGLMGPPSTLKSKQAKQGAKDSSISLAARLDGTEFNFEADFDDIIDVNGHIQDI